MRFEGWGIYEVGEDTSPPPFSVSKWLKKVEKLTSFLADNMLIYSNLSFREHSFIANSFASEIGAAEDFSIEDVSSALLSSIVNIAKDKMDTDTARLLASVTVGWDYFRYGIPFPSYSWTDREVYLPVYVSDICRLPARNEKKSQLFEVTFTGCAGPVAGQILTYKLTKYTIKSMIFAAGFSYRLREPLDWIHEDLGGMFITLKTKRQNGIIGLHAGESNSSQRKWNLDLLKERNTLCRVGDNQGNPCVNCNLGRNQCFLARHKHEYSFGKCCLPPDHEGFIVTEDVCLKCIRQGRIKENVKRDVPKSA